MSTIYVAVVALLVEALIGSVVLAVGTPNGGVFVGVAIVCVLGLYALLGGDE